VSSPLRFCTIYLRWVTQVVRMQLVVYSTHNVMQVDDLPQAGGIPVDVIDCLRKEAPLDAKLSDIIVALLAYDDCESVPSRESISTPPIRYGDAALVAS